MARTGRPRTFDRDKAVEQAMMLFWENGYESTSLAQLKAGIGGGISAPSFYAAFGSKETLFREVLQRYLDTHGQVTETLFDVGLAPREAIEKTLRDSARMQTDRSHPAGCLVTISRATGVKSSDSLQQTIAADRKRTKRGIEQCVERAINAGELPDNTAARSLAVTFDTFLQGMTLKAREGLSRPRLYASIRQMMSLWDNCAEEARDESLVLLDQPR